ncbi:MAG: hypothetical protein EOO77_13680, partial [Oxalobacteraceae bacterium]
WEIQKDGTQTQLEAASISLNDCLACSGCVTTAESVLIGLQSWSEVEETLKAAEKKIVVASICPQSIASIAASYNLPLDTTFRKLRTLLKSLGFSHILSTNVGRELSLHEAGVEFVNHYRSSPTTPLLTSACPGWICYAEKQKSAVIPSISTVRSPQQMTGVMLKDVLSRTKGVSRDEIYHVAIMPCFDKKLEASRQEFQVDGVRDVDTVVTSAEVVSMMRDSGIDIAALPPDETDTFGPASGRQPGSSSGGYLAHILCHAARELFSIDLDPERLDSDPRVRITMQRSPKLKEVALVDPAVDDGVVLLRFAEAYGFRQITSLASKLAPKLTSARRPARKVEYHYVEVMACESGCINGGGQVRSTGSETNTDLLHRVEALYRTEPVSAATTTTTTAAAIRAWWDPPSSDWQDKTRTTYSAVAPLVNPLSSKW